MIFLIVFHCLLILISHLPCLELFCDLGHRYLYYQHHCLDYLGRRKPNQQCCDHQFEEQSNSELEYSSPSILADYPTSTSSNLLSACSFGRPFAKATYNLLTALSRLRPANVLVARSISGSCLSQGSGDSPCSYRRFRYFPALAAFATSLSRCVRFVMSSRGLCSR